MRTGLTLLSIACLVLPAAVLAEDTKVAEVKEIDIKDLKKPQPRGRVDRPTIITSTAELARTFPDEDTQASVQKHVDFTKQKLIYFAWAGSGQDKLTFTVGKGEKGVEVVFHYKRGLTRDLRPHTHLYVVPKDASWKLADG
jgi:hypothetical protein